MRKPDFYLWMDHPKAAERQHAEIARLTGVGQGRMLEFFSGDGAYLKYFQDRGWECLGVESDARLAEIAMLENAVPTLQGTPMEVNFPRESYDLVRIRGALCCCDAPKALLEMAFQATAPTGYLVAETWNGSGAPACHRAGRPQNRFNRRELRERVRKAGYEVGGVIAPAMGDSIWAPYASLRGGANSAAIPARTRRILDGLLGIIDRGSLLVVFAQRPPHQ